MKKIFLFTFFVFSFFTFSNSYALEVTFLNPKGSDIGITDSSMTNLSFYGGDESSKVDSTTNGFCQKFNMSLVSFKTNSTTTNALLFQSGVFNSVPANKTLSEIVCFLSDSPSTSSLYKTKVGDGKYVEIAYQGNDGTYYFNQKALIDLLILASFVFLIFFTFVSLTIKFFKLGKK